MLQRVLNDRTGGVGIVRIEYPDRLGGLGDGVDQIARGPGVEALG